MTVVVFMADEDEVEVLFLAFGADDVGPPRALEEAVADAYEPAARRLLRCCFDDLPLSLFSLEEEVEVWADSESLPLDDDEEEEPLLLLSPLFDDDDRGMATAASLRILLILLPVFILSMVLAVVVISVVAIAIFRFQDFFSNGRSTYLRRVR